VYIADPSAHAWRDGKMYIYGSKDVNPKRYCSTTYDVLSSHDLIDWAMHARSFASAGEGDGVPYSDAELYAPDCVERDGRYYLYYCLPDGSEGVATSTSPTGPFLNGEAIGGMREIDPSVFIDGDGQAYVTWGQLTMKMAKLNGDMRTIDPSSVSEAVIAEAEHHFHEGSQLFKRNGVYYLACADISRRGRPTSIGYATANRPFGPYTYRGVIVDNFGSDPHVWNNHGYVAPFKGRWYVFYHRSTHGTETMRKACVEPIRFNDDGTIPQVEMTTQGAGLPLDAFETIDASRACYLTGNVRVELTGEREELTRVASGNTAAYKYLRFDRPPQRYRLR
jgi:beta-xylosidase